MPEEPEIKPKKRAVEAGAVKKTSNAGSTRKKPADAGATPSAAKDKEATQAPAKKGVARKPPADKRPAEARPTAEELLSEQVATSPLAEPPALGDRTAGGTVADNPLHKKLGLRPDSVGVLIAPPEDDNPLLPLPQGLTVLPGLGELSSLTGPYEYVHVFARDRGDLAGAFAALRDCLTSGGSLWVSWMKQSSDRRRSTFTDLNETIIRRIALTHGMVDVKVMALDKDWSALRLVRRKR